MRPQRMGRGNVPVAFFRFNLPNLLNTLSWLNTLIPLGGYAASTTCHSTAQPNKIATALKRSLFARS